MTPTAWPGAHSFREEASGHSSHCICSILLDPFFLTQSEAFPTPNHQEGLEHYPVCRHSWLPWGWVLCLLLAGNGASFLQRQLMIVQLVGLQQPQLLNMAWRGASCGSCASEVFNFCLFFSLYQANLIFHYLRYVAFISVLWETEITATWRPARSQGNYSPRLINFGLT